MTKSESQTFLCIYLCIYTRASTYFYSPMLKCLSIYHILAHHIAILPTHAFKVGYAEQINLMNF